MRGVKVNVELGRNDEYKILVMSDLHIGNASVDRKLLKYVTERIDDVDGFILGGDLAEFIYPANGENRFDYESYDYDLFPPEKQINYLFDLFGGKDRKCITIIDGNHEYTWSKRTGVNPSRELAKMLGADAYACGFSNIIRLAFKRSGSSERRCIDIFIHHGWSAARTEGARVLRLIDLSRIIYDCDIYLMGHLHDLGLKHSETVLAANKRMDIVSRTRYYAFTGSFLRGYASGIRSYVESKALKPSRLGSLLIYVTPFPGEAKTPAITFGEITESGGYIFENTPRAGVKGRTRL